MVCSNVIDFCFVFRRVSWNLRSATQIFYGIYGQPPKSFTWHEGIPFCGASLGAPLLITWEDLTHLGIKSSQLMPFLRVGWGADGHVCNTIQTLTRIPPGDDCF